MKFWQSMGQQRKNQYFTLSLSNTFFNKTFCAFPIFLAHAMQVQHIPIPLPYAIQYSEFSHLHIWVLASPNQTAFLHRSHRMLELCRSEQPGHEDGMGPLPLELEQKGRSQQGSHPWSQPLSWYVAECWKIHNHGETAINVHLALSDHGQETARYIKLLCNDISIQQILTYLLIYLLTPWSRVLLEKLTGFAANQEIYSKCNSQNNFQ